MEKENAEQPAKRHKADVVKSDDTPVEAALEDSAVAPEEVALAPRDVAREGDEKEDTEEAKEADEGSKNADGPKENAEGTDIKLEEVLKVDDAVFMNFDDAIDLGVTSTAPFFTREEPWVLQGESPDSWWGHESLPWLYNETSELYFHPPSKQLFRRPDPDSEAVVAATFEDTAQKQERFEGVVQWWRKKKGFGFLVATGNTERIFCHQKQIEDEVVRFKGFRIGDPVTFELAVINDKICASAVRCGTLLDTNVDVKVDEEDEEEEDSGSDVEMDLFAELQCSYATCKGTEKENNEDRYIEKIKLPILNAYADMVFLAVLDGHSGHSCSDYVQLNWSKNICTAMGSVKKKMKKSSDQIPFALQKSLEVIDHNFLQIAKKTVDMAGSTALGVVFYGPDEDGLLRMFTAHLGDSRAVLCRDGKAFRLTDDHKPDREDEYKRVKDLGGKIFAPPIAGMPARVVVLPTRQDILGLAVSRAVGDFPFKEPVAFVSSKAEVNQYNVDMEADEFVVMASDGIFDVITDQRLVEFVRQGGTADGLIHLARQLQSGDDCTVIIIRFGWRKDLPSVLPSVPKEPSAKIPDSEGASGSNLEQLMFEPRHNLSTPYFDIDDAK